MRAIVGARSILFSQMFAGLGAGQDATIPAGVTVTYDMVSPPTYGCIEISGTLRVSQIVSTVLPFRCMEIMSGGTFECGTTTSPYPRGSITHTITPSGARSLDLQIASPIGPAIADSNRGIMVMDGGTLSLVGAVPTVTIFKLGANANIGDSSIIADRAVTLKAGDVLEISTTKYFSEGLSDTSFVNASTAGGIRRPGYGREMVTVASNVTNATTIPISQSVAPNEIGEGGAATTSSTIQFFHHGKIQYLVPPAFEAVVGTNLSYTQRTTLAGDSFGTVNGTTITGTDVLAAIAAGAPQSLDHRATVGLLTHPIKFGSPSDTDWGSSGYGGHIMAMGNTSKRMMQGVQLERVGQAGFLGRYPIHDHMRSYKAFTGTVTVPPSGTFLGDLNPTYNYTKQCSILSSSNRGITIHGTNAVNTFQNVIVDTDTHAIFLEDHAEENNVIDGNFISSVGPMRRGMDHSATFVGDTSGTVLTVSSVTGGTIVLNQRVYTRYSSIYAGTITAFLTGAGGTGTYRISSPDVLGSQALKTSDAIKAHDLFSFCVDPGVSVSGAAGIWNTNPNNYLRNNIVSGAQNGIWNSFAYPYYSCYQERGVRTGNGTIQFESIVHNPLFATAIGSAAIAGMPAEVITLHCTNATVPATFSRTGSISGLMSPITAGVRNWHGSESGYQYTIATGTVPFVVGDEFVFDTKRFLGCVGASRDVVLTTGNTTYGSAPGWNDTMLQHLNNESSCSSHMNMASGSFTVSEIGVPETIGGTHSAIGRRVPMDGSVDITTLFKLEGLNLWKGGYCQYFNETDHPWYKGWTVAGGRDITAAGGIAEMIQGNVNATSGGGQPAKFDGCLFVPKTLDDYYSAHKINIMVSYGGGINRTNCILVPCKATTLTGPNFTTFGRALIVEDGSSMRLWDFYLYPTNHHFTRDLNTTILGADPGYLGIRSPPVHMVASNRTATELTASYSGIVGSCPLQWNQGNSGAFKLPTDGTLFKQAGGWHIHNRPFLTYGTTGAVFAQSGVNYPNYNGKLVSSSHYYIGVLASFANGVDVINAGKAVNYTRLQADGITPVTNGDWNFDDSSGVNYANMRHAALLTMEFGGTPAKVSWPAGVADISPYPPTSCSFDFEGFSASTQHVVLAVPAATGTVSGVAGTNGVNTCTFVVASPNTLNGLLAMTQNSYWKDTVNKLMYIHVWGTTLTNRYSGDTYNTDRKWLNTWSITVS